MLGVDVVAVVAHVPIRLRQFGGEEAAEFGAERGMFGRIVEEQWRSLERGVGPSIAAALTEYGSGLTEIFTDDTVAIVMNLKLSVMCRATR